jgi:hypothetical protein
MSEAGQAQLRVYLERIAAGLDGPRRQRSRILTELREGLNDALAAHTAAGLPPERAAGAAIAGFGRPDQITTAFAAELATGYARHTLLSYVLTGPLVGVWWLLLWHPDLRQGEVTSVIATIPAVPLIASALVIVAAVVATTGRLMRWLPETSPRLALIAVGAVALLAAAGDLLVIAAWTRSGGDVSRVAVVAVTASVIRIVCSLMVTRRTALLHHRLGSITPRQ